MLRLAKHTGQCSLHLWYFNWRKNYKSWVARKGCVRREHKSVRIRLSKPSWPFSQLKMGRKKKENTACFYGTEGASGWWTFAHPSNLRFLPVRCDALSNNGVGLAEGTLGLPVNGSARTSAKEAFGAQLQTDPSDALIRHRPISTQLHPTPCCRDAETPSVLSSSPGSVV